MTLEWLWNNKLLKQAEDKAIKFSQYPNGEWSMWLLLLVAYGAPPDAVNWKGPWEFGLAVLREERFANEADCLITGMQIKAKLNEGMLAPVRYHCIRVDAGLPAGAAR